MTSALAIQSVKDFWNREKPRILREYNEGYIVIPCFPTKEEHYLTQLAVYNAYPEVVRQKASSVDSFTAPMILDVLEEQFKARNLIEVETPDSDDLVTIALNPNLRNLKGLVH